MKIAMIGQKGLPAIWGGVERHVEELATRLAQDGHEVTVYSRCWYSDWKRPKYKGVILRFVPSIHTKHLDAITHTLVATLDALRRDFDIIHYHGVGPALLAWIPRLLKPSVKVAATFHCRDRYHGKWGVLAKLALWLGEWAACRFPHKTIVVSQTLQKYAQKTYGCETVYIPNGVNIAPAANAKGLAKLNLESGRYILHVSRLIPHKATHYLIEAFRQAKKKRPDLLAGLKLAIVGDSSGTESYARYLQTISSDLPEVIFTGWQNGPLLHTLYANAAFFVHPSQAEGLPLAVLEAESFGQAVIASDIPEHREIIIDKRFLFVHNQTADLTKKLIWLLENPEIKKVAGIQNRCLVEREYNWQDIAHQTEYLYERMLYEPKEINLPIFTVKKLPA